MTGCETVTELGDLKWEELMTSTASTESFRGVVDQIRLDVIKAMALRAALELDLFTPLDQGPMKVEELSRSLGVKARRLKLLLYQLVISDFLELKEERFSNTPISAELFVKGAPGYYGGIHGLWTEMFTAMLETSKSIRSDAPEAKVDFEAMSAEELGTFLKGLHGMAEAAGRRLAENSIFSDTKRIVDVGGGSGGVAMGLCKVHQHLDATVVDLPSVVPIAEEMALEAGLADRIKGSIENILERPISGMYDIAIARALFQVLSVQDCQIAAQNIAAALSEGGKLFIVGHVTDDSHLAPEATVGMNILFLNIFDEGQAYSEAQYGTWLKNAGFKDIVRTPFIAGNSLISATKAS